MRIVKNTPTTLNTSCVALYRNCLIFERIDAFLVPIQIVVSVSSFPVSCSTGFLTCWIFLEDWINQNTSKQNSKLVHVPRDRVPSVRSHTHFEYSTKLNTTK